MSKKYLVTGGLGFIGSALSHAILEDGAEVRILDNSFRGAKERLGSALPDFEMFEGDIRDPGLVSAAVDGIDAVCHLAYINGTSLFYEQPRLVLDVAVKGMINVLDACRQHKVSELFLASSSEVYQTPPTVPTSESVALSVPDVHNPRYSYGGGKIISELMAINYGRSEFERVVVFRPHNVFGPNMGWRHVIPEFVTRMLDLKQESGSESRISFPIQGSGQQTRAFVYIDDFVRGVMRVMADGEHLAIYNIGTMEERSILDVAEAIGKSLGLTLSIVPGPEASGGTSRRCPDTSALQELGFVPKVPFETGLDATVDWYLADWNSKRSQAA